ncbi:MAG: ATP-binding cassette domain-containing protein [Clostridia bacterium]|nr:ATP-binding cassette domain-containing protein [Clostridia bacterium]MBQ8513588.1 ATP-binding cassette domain-containing protein [Clostridia bacterium]
MNIPLITCKNLTVGYDGCRLCGNIDFTIHEGEYLCVVGHSGIGKSALVATLMGIIKPVDGEVIYENGLNVREIGCLPQEQQFRVEVKVLDVVMEGCLNHVRGLFVGRKARELAEKNLARLGVADLAKRKFGELSGGQKQRVLLARALCAAKRVLILDEPMHGLDAVARDELFREIIRINHEDGIAVLIVDHEAIDGTVLHLSDNQLYCGPVENYVNTIPGQFYFNGRII